MSKDRVVTASQTSDGARAGRERIEARKLASARWGTPTAFGVPVEPDV